MADKFVLVAFCIAFAGLVILPLAASRYLKPFIGDDSLSHDDAPIDSDTIWSGTVTPAARNIAQYGANVAHGVVRNETTGEYIPQQKSIRPT